MAQTTTWKINDMVRDDATGGVKTVYWECHVSDNTHTECSATEGGKLRLEPDATASDFVAYADLTEAIVIGWIPESAITSAQQCVQGQLDSMANPPVSPANTALPWATP